jgi:hypothetical protein
MAFTKLRIGFSISALPIQDFYNIE